MRVRTQDLVRVVMIARDEPFEIVLAHRTPQSDRCTHHRCLPDQMLDVAPRCANAQADTIGSKYFLVPAGRYMLAVDVALGPGTKVPEMTSATMAALQKHLYVRFSPPRGAPNDPDTDIRPTDPDTGPRNATTLAAQLDKRYCGAEASLLEGLDEMLDLLLRPLRARSR